jgi:hypothetical protein
VDFSKESVQTMVRIIAAEIVAIHPDLTELHLGFAMGGEDSPIASEAQDTLGRTIRLCNLVGWKDIAKQAQRILDRAKEGESGPRMEALAEDLQHAFEQKLNGLHAVLVEERDAALFVDAAKALCGDLHVDLAVSAEELNLAGRAFALGLSTAAVSHAMRSVEASLYVLARKLAISFPAPVQLQDWAVLTEKIEAELKKWKTQPRSTQRDEESKWLSGLLVPANAFRFAWRNHVAHARTKYEDDEARRVLGHVGEYLKQLSDGL